MNIIKWSLFLIGLLVVMIATPIIVTYTLKNIMCWKELIAGPIMAMAVVFYSYFCAPKYNVTWSVLAFLAGAVLAYEVHNLHWYPECHELAYETTYIPLAITYISGLLAVVFSIHLSKKGKYKRKQI